MSMGKRTQKRKPVDPRHGTPITSIDVDGTELGLYLHDRGILWRAERTGTEGWTGVSELVRIGMFVLAATGQGLGEGEEITLYLPGGDATLTIGNFVTDLHVTLDDTSHAGLEGFVAKEEMARAVTAGIQMLKPSYSLLELGIDDIKLTALRNRHVAAYRELKSKA